MSARMPAAACSTVVSALLALASSAAAQLTPERLYFPINRSMPMEVRVPAETVGDVRIALLEPGTAKPVETAAAAPGAVDLAAMFPLLWTTSEPRVLYAQLLVGEKPIGPSVVLQPMLAPRYAARADRSRDPIFPEQTREERVYSGIRAYPDRHVVLTTSRGDIELRLEPEHAPNTCFEFRSLVEGGFYQDVIVHRVASLVQRAEPDIIQAGDPVGNGTGGPGYFIDLEPSTLPHDFGVISMARGSDPNSGGSQFFICLNRDGTSFLDGKYAAFARVVSGAETVVTLAATPVSPDNRPIDPPVIRSARLVDAPPYGTGPTPPSDPRKKRPER